jgi:hypothetical protein
LLLFRLALLDVINKSNKENKTKWKQNAPVKSADVALSPFIAGKQFFVGREI